MSRGVIYIASGQRYIDEATHSAATLKQHMPDLPVTLFTHQEVNSPYFDKVENVSNLGTGSHVKSNKIHYLSLTPYERTLFMDTDTHVCHEFNDLFDLLGRFDIALTHAPWHKLWEPSSERYSNNLPSSFPEFNSGVMLYRRTPQVWAMLDDWLRIFKDSNAKADQPSLREALYQSDLRFTTLMPEYNFRLGKHPAYLNGPVRILHGRHPNLEAVARIINQQHRIRIVRPASVATGILAHTPLLRRLLKKRLEREQDFVYPED